VRYLAASLLVFVYLIFCWLCWRNYRRKQNLSMSSNIDSSECILIGYASQTGSALHIAQQTAAQLEQEGKSVQILSLNQITPAQLTQVSTALFIVSTYGEGEAPDNGNRFIVRALGELDANALQHLQTLILGLGDSSYAYFCGFAHQLERVLHERGARFMADIVEVDRMDASALRHWQYYLGKISGNSHFSDWSKPGYEKWGIVARECVNPGGLGAPAFHIQLQPMQGNITPDLWRAGDIVEIGPCNSPVAIKHFLQQLGRELAPELLLTRELSISDARLAELKNYDDEQLIESLSELSHREYSIASVPSEGSLDLLVRQVRDSHNQLGVGSGWLTQHAGVNQAIRLRIRSNPHFHAPEQPCPLILIGNGTGIAGLRAHIVNPARTNVQQWLFFGERSELSDDFFSADIHQWLQSGRLARVNKIYSRDALPDEPRYVQDLLLPNAQEIRQWVNDGAAIFVCGSLQGMAQGVDDALREILGAEQLELMADQRRYCRDVY
jgi:sulfite reductase (NADPH) flavoprotein alpha-component